MLENEVNITHSHNFYQRLGVHPTATSSEISTAFRKLSKIYHPDKNNAADKPKFTSLFHLLTEANEVLTDPQKRHVYDNIEITDSGFKKAFYRFRLATENVLTNYPNEKNFQTLQSKLAELSEYEEVILDFEINYLHELDAYVQSAEPASSFDQVTRDRFHATVFSTYKNLLTILSTWVPPAPQAQLVKANDSHPSSITMMVSPVSREQALIIQQIETNLIEMNTQDPENLRRTNISNSFDAIIPIIRKAIPLIHMHKKIDEIKLILNEESKLFNGVNTTSVQGSVVVIPSCINDMAYLTKNQDPNQILERLENVKQHAVVLLLIEKTGAEFKKRLATVNPVDLKEQLLQWKNTRRELIDASKEISIDAPPSERAAALSERKEILASLLKINEELEQTITAQQAASAMDNTAKAPVSSTAVLTMQLPPLPLLTVGPSLQVLPVSQPALVEPSSLAFTFSGVKGVADRRLSGVEISGEPVTGPLQGYLSKLDKVLNPPALADSNVQKQFTLMHTNVDGNKEQIIVTSTKDLEKNFIITKQSIKTTCKDEEIFIAMLKSYALTHPNQKAVLVASEKMQKIWQPLVEKYLAELDIPGIVFRTRAEIHARNSSPPPTLRR